MFTFQTASFSCYIHVIPQDLHYLCILLGLNEAQVILFLRGVNITTSKGAKANIGTWLSRKWFLILTDEIYYTLNMLVNIH